ncbi:LOW QUALITY PROTEIN: acylsugar acyltransferase 3-like [Pistacia vera]|uniref:LOW QUALITY PROTEIN: acylsugar acyltransferase 3-like n=1 Tax=Pistacia vera TaxID=55513 RepID=UPI001263BA57|nr:LOW QUALITY PROTEIN: acylsugar acyltransferase 3-like [Pistacia vera]
MEVEIISREVIKPSSPTPPHLRLHNLSFFYQFIPSWFVPVLLFYPNKASYSATKRLHLLKTSLSETLVRYYPLAERIGDSESIECNDEGAVIWEARTNCGLSEILKHPENETLDQLLPDDLQWTTNSNIPLVIQVTFFDCGGMAIGLCLSHRILDMSSMGKFINNWANTARGTGDHQNVLPDFSAATLFPRGDLPVPPPHKLPGGTVVTRRFVFSASKITSLKAIASKNVQNPTRVEVVSALIYKCASSASRANSNSSNPTLFVQSLNLRSRTGPPLPENFMGNVVFIFSVLTSEENKIVLHSVVGQKREELAKFLIVDFGWGRPEWVTTTSNGMKNSILLLDTRDGLGIEAPVTLEEQDMAIFERDDELLSFATVNPGAVEAATT